ncbi:S-adenosyl-L-methionine-dependent methyltransferase [Gonapodya prolifera JEL478]|uniref:Sterol 24-C-methyltransferase n=1 Tax=Gonapodya prolifera (strain JEL478) TaxID=1344416 RepID=A0A139A5W0_GONPJ|nr:S-adenosyl-L-methionine-dependent methyltransferase [Gonapodya prolifera JEL478]|eukprot:KXS11753.1 S-adenosyl-L-methionine-dependent methyltransferase [Gonapodya prolifera JEL478]
MSAPAAPRKAVAAEGYQALWSHNKDTGDVFKQTSDDIKEERKAAAPVMTNYYYDLATDLYEYGWGTSFHFARMFTGSSFASNIARHEDYLALKLGLKPGMRVLDVGCGVGGPLREIAKFSGATVVGLNNNQYQVERCKMYNKKFGLEAITDVVKGNFLEIPFPDNTFDAIYSIEATCHAPHPSQVYGEIFRVLKPGGKYACYEWCTTAKYDENDREQRLAIHQIEEGDSIPHLYRTYESLAAVRSVGFDVIEEYDLADPEFNKPWGAQTPWYGPLAGIMANYSVDEFLRYFRSSKIGGTITDVFVSVMEFVGLAPKGTKAASQTLITASEGLVYSGKKETFTPMYFFLGKKPEA